MRNYKHIDRYLNNLQRDIYGQPRDASHTEWAKQAIDQLWPKDATAVLDVGCGHGFLESIIKEKGAIWAGVTLGRDYAYCAENELQVLESDMSFLGSLFDDACDLVFARHVLEHSPFPILTLMEWKRVSSKYLMLIAPAPEYWTYRGKNHYSMAPKEQLRWWLDRVGWKIINETVFTNSDPLFLHFWRTDLINAGHLNPGKASEHFPPKALDVEYRFLCEKCNEQTQ